jgi:uncharacterized protein YndB with AHSA1/START domain
MADQVRRERFLPAELGEVWEALTEPEGLRAWLAEEAEIDLRPGGELRVRLRDGEERSGFVEEVEGPERLSFWWRGSGEEGEPLTRVELSLEQAEGGTLLRVAETRVVTTVEAVLGAASAAERPRGPQMSAPSGLALMS